MLIQTLRQHPDILAFGELFLGPKIGFNVNGYDNRSKKMLRWRNKRPVRFLEKEIFSGREAYSAVGFKAFPNQLDRFSQVADRLEEMKDLRVIALRRRNMLRTLVSKRIAEESRNFGIKDPSERPERTVQLDPAHCERFFEQQERQWEETLKRFQGHSVYRIDYEHLVDDFREKVQEILAFLDVDRQPLEVPTLKKDPRRLSEIVENYYDLKSIFQGSRWSAFFQEGDQS